MRTPVGTESREMITAYELTLLDVVAVGAMVATLPVAVAPVSAAQVTVVVWPTLSRVASASAKLADTCITVRSASWMKPDEDEELDADPDPPPDPDPDAAPTLPLMAV